MVERHGMKIVGLRKACSVTKDEPPYSDWHYQINYDTETGEVWTDCIFGRNTWNQYRESNIITVANTDRHMAMQEIADSIFDCCRARKEWKENYA